MMQWFAREKKKAAPEIAEMIRMRSMRKTYDTGKVRVEALRGIDLEIERGSFVAIVGPSGSGKSTLMNLVGCLDTPSAGEYVLAGQVVSDLDRAQLAAIRNRRIGFVFQNFNLLSQITAWENVELPLIFGGVGRRERRRRVERLFEKVGLADRSRHRPTELSGGQMQRVAVARALAMDPDVILADEPTGNLDSASGGEIMKLFDELAEMGRTLLMVTHDMGLARRAHRIVEIRDGVVTSDEPAVPRSATRS